MTKKIIVIGAGLAGSEAAWQIAKNKIPVTLIEMRPKKIRPYMIRSTSENWYAAIHYVPQACKMPQDF